MANQKRRKILRSKMFIWPASLKLEIDRTPERAQITVFQGGLPPSNFLEPYISQATTLYIRRVIYYAGGPNPQVVSHSWTVDKEWTPDDNESKTNIPFPKQLNCISKTESRYLLQDLYQTLPDQNKKNAGGFWLYVTLESTGTIVYEKWLSFQDVECGHWLNSFTTPYSTQPHLAALQATNSKGTPIGEITQAMSINRPTSYQIAQ